ncbi:hypothetical protein [Streptomyces sp. SudanB52_2052]|uniref:hypothetical protein n=1 Tax=Streptomyces sp. SudanB52_2052 TaxID=3035276 RepID=UPI0004A04682|nr:hypothetical protein DF19_06385 [Streptomyces olindensis]
MVRHGARWSASRVGRWGLLRLIVLVALAVLIGLVAAVAGLPPWTPVIGILLLLFIDDVLRAHGERRAARQGGQQGLSASPVDEPPDRTRR